MRHPGLICLLGLTALLFGACYSGAQALDMYRNSTRYEIDVKTPDGLKFHEAGVDRVFSADGIDVNLRLIQDRYDTCADLIEERQGNRRKDGYTVASDRSLSQLACSVTLKNPFDGQMMTSHYLWIDVCSCFAARLCCKDLKRRGIPPFSAIKRPNLRDSGRAKPRLRSEHSARYRRPVQRYEPLHRCLLSG